MDIAPANSGKRRREQREERDERGGGQEERGLLLLQEGSQQGDEDQKQNANANQVAQNEEKEPHSPIFKARKRYFFKDEGFDPYLVPPKDKIASDYRVSGKNYQLSRL